MNIDFISREALKTAVRQRQWHIDDIEEVMKIIDNAPTITPTFGLFKEMLCSECEKRPQGKWIKTNELIGEYFHNVFVCNQCGARAIDKLKFCPECGADMKGGVE